MLFFDTNVLAKLAHPQQKQTVLPYLTQRTEETWVTSSIVIFEFVRPSQRRTQIHKVQAWIGQVLDDVVAFDESAGLQAAEVEESLASHGISLQMRDLLIAAQARDVGATFITFDNNDFQNQPVQQLLDVEVLTP